MLNSGYQDVGFAVVNGTLQGGETTLVVAFYAKPTTPAAQPQSTQTANAEPSASPQESPPNSDQAEAVASEAPSTETNDQPAQPTVIVPSAEKQYSLSSPLSITRALPWGKLTTVWMLGSVAVVDVMRHTAIWRLHRKGLLKKRIWFKTHPLLQAGLIVSVLLLLIGTSYGVVK
jgi:hypothetical protein